MRVWDSNSTAWFWLIAAAIICSVPNLVYGQDKTSDLPRMTARYHFESGTKKGFLIVKVEIPSGSYIYGLKQGQPLRPTQLKLKSGDLVNKPAKFKSDKSPKIVEFDPLFKTRLEKHEGVVQFYVPIEAKFDGNLRDLKIEAVMEGQVCSDLGYCKPISGQKCLAKFGGFYDRQAELVTPITKK